MNQLTLSFDRPLSRRTDPATSHQAAERSAEFRGKHAAAIFAYLIDHPDGATYREIAAGTRLEPVAVGRRLKELRETAGVYADGVRDGMQVWRVRR
jgi:DNA-binding transcriptional ArsR family regulator